MRLSSNAASLALIVAVMFSARANGEQFLLKCKYPETDATLDTPESVRLTPRDLIVYENPPSISWGDVKVAAELTDAKITFIYAGFSYVISRVTGEIRFHNPERLQQWRHYMASMLSAAQQSGRVEQVDRAKRIVAQSQSSSFDGKEHVGQCERVQNRAF